MKEGREEVGVGGPKEEGAREEVPAYPSQREVETSRPLEDAYRGCWASYTSASAALRASEGLDTGSEQVDLVGHFLSRSDPVLFPCLPSHLISPLHALVQIRSLIYLLSSSPYPLLPGFVFSPIQSDDVIEDVPPGEKPQKFSHGFFDKEVAPLRAVYFKIVLSMTLVTILVMCESVFFMRRPAASSLI